MRRRTLIRTILWLLVLAVGGGPRDSAALTAEEIFFRGDACHRKLLAEPEALNYRDNWFPCIRMFQEAYTAEPSGRYAAASLYMTGKMYLELYQRSFKSSDKREALDYFQRVINRFPDSDYRPKAENGMAAFGSGAPKTPDASDASEVSGTPGEDPPELKRVRVEKELSPPEESSAVAGKTKRRGALYAASKARYRESRKRAAKRAARKTPRPPDPRPTPARYDVYPAEGGRVVITGLRVWSNPSYTRIVVDASGETTYTYRFLERDPAIEKPRRLYIDFDNSRLGARIQKIIPINDDLLLDARAGQYTADSVRVVIDIKSFKNYKVFSLRNPFRTIIDVWGREAGGTLVADGGARPRPRIEPPARERPLEPVREDPPEPLPLGEAPGGGTVTANDLAKQFALCVGRIIIDPGHGGKDAGAVGYYKHVHEKDVVLEIGKRLARKIKRQLGCEVIMTRNSDRFLTLEERTAIANTRNADLFISLHTNAHSDRRAYGIETYFLNLATDEDAIRVAARENATSRKNISDLQAILNDLMQNAKINESSRLAGHVQKSLHGHLKGKYSHIKNKGVKQAPFYVLLGAQMPAILIETSFISNKRECNRLTNAGYQENLCDAIVGGIRNYIRETNPTALLGSAWKGSG